MSLLVLYLELLGTYFGAWKWDTKQGVFQTINPPLGAIYFYLGGDGLLSRILKQFLSYRKLFS